MADNSPFSLHKPRMCSESVFTHTNMGKFPNGRKVVYVRRRLISCQRSAFKYAKMHSDETNNHLSYRNRFFKKTAFKPNLSRPLTMYFEVPFRKNFRVTSFSFVIFCNFSFSFPKSLKGIPTKQTTPNRINMRPKRAVKKKTFKFFLKHGTNPFSFGGVA